MSLVSRPMSHMSWGWFLLSAWPGDEAWLEDSDTMASFSALAELKPAFQSLDMKAPRNSPVCTMNPGAAIPFRWNLTRRSELGGLLAGPRATAYPGFHAELAGCSARVLATAGDADLYFVGRSPESIFDYLTGLVLETSWARRLNLLPFSCYGSYALRAVREEGATALLALHAYLAHHALTPRQVLQRARPVTFVDLVCSGSTFGNFLSLLRNWTREQREDWTGIRRQLRFVCVVERGRASSEWKEDADWLRELSTKSVRCVTVSPRFWRYLGNAQKKTMPSFSPRRWGSPDVSRPPRSDAELAALRLGHHLFELGRKRSHRRDLARRLGQQHAMRERWLRALVSQLRGRGRTQPRPNSV